jgi:hypothetical protein
MDQELVRYDMTETAMSPETVVRQVNLVQQVMKQAMREGEHFGVIPGCQKPSLFKSGAEKLSLTFRLAPNCEVLQANGENGHREYRVNCFLTHIPTGQVFGQGVGVCSTMESKYRYRGGEKVGTGKAVPKDYWNLKKEGKASEAQALLGGRGYSAAKVDGIWQICETGEKQENPDIADTYNTVLKMAKKRAHVDAVLTATAASDIFTQDVEDLDLPVNGSQPAAVKPEPQVEQAKPVASAPAGQPARQPQPSSPDSPIIPKQVQAIGALLTKANIMTDIDRGNKVAEILGMDFKAVNPSFGNLTKGQAAKVINALSGEPEA